MTRRQRLHRTLTVLSEVGFIIAILGVMRLIAYVFTVTS